MSEKWILASSSPRRVALLRTLIPHLEICPASVEELHVAPKNMPPETIANLNAERKAEHVAMQYPHAYIIGADTIVIFKNQIFNKPRDMEEARYMLQQLSGQTHNVVTSVCVMHKMNSFLKTFSVISPVTFAAMAPDFIEHYLQEIQPLDKAGAYAIQHPLTKKIATYAPEDYANIMGFPINAFQQALHGIL